MDRTKGSVSAVAGFCLFWSLILFAMAAAVYGMAGDGGLLAGEMRRFAPSETTGLPDQEYPEMGRMIADYLTGRKQEFQYTFRDEKGMETACFRPHEAAHMADCRGLISLAGTLRWIAAGAALVFFGTGIGIRNHRKAFLSGMIAGFVSGGLVLAGVLVWGIIDFDGLFVTFHKVAFSNDGWLLDPRTDMLIRLMPTPFFVNLGIRVMLAVALTALAAFGGAVAARVASGKRKQKAGHTEKAARDI